MKIRGTAKGTIHVLLEENGSSVAQIPVDSRLNEWTESETKKTVNENIHPLFFQFEGEGSLDTLAFTIS